jgi:WD40 repeat protein
MEGGNDSLLTRYKNSFDIDVLSVSFHPTQPRLATCSQTAPAKIWTFSPDNLEFTPASQPLQLSNYVGSSSGQINSVSFNSDGNFLATSSNKEFDARIWSMSNMTDVTTLNVAHVRHPLSCIAFGQFGYLVTGYTDNTVRLWQFSHLSNMAVCHETLDIHTQYVISLTFHPTLFRIFASGSFDKTAKIWRILPDGINGINAICVATLSGHAGCVASVAFHPRISLLATGSFDKTAKLWQYSLGNSIATCVATLTGHTNYVLSVAFHPTVPLLATGSRDMTAKLWRFLRDGTNATCVETITYTEKVRSLSFHPVFPVLAICHDMGNSVTLYDCRKIPTYYDKYMKDMESIRKLKLYKAASALASKLFTQPQNTGPVPKEPLDVTRGLLIDRMTNTFLPVPDKGGSKWAKTRAKTRYRKRSRTRCKSRSKSKTR